MRISHFVGHSLVRFTPGRIATLWGRYTRHEGMAFALNRRGGVMYREPLNPRGFHCVKGEPKKAIQEWIWGSDVLHFHDDSYPAVLRSRGLEINPKSTLVYQAHIGSIPERYFQIRPPRWRVDKKVKHSAITNGYGHLFDKDEKMSLVHKQVPRKWGRLADILDLDHPTYRAEPGLRRPVEDGPLRVVYTYSNHKEGAKINAKRPRGHRRLVDGIEGVEFIMVHGRPFEEAMAIKKTAHVVLEECFSPYLHLSALEGAAVGAMVLTKTNAYTRSELSGHVGAPLDAWPFYEASDETLRDTLKHLVANRDLVKEWGQKGYAWMHRHYRPEALLGKYLEFYGRDGRTDIKAASRPTEDAGASDERNKTQDDASSAKSPTQAAGGDDSEDGGDTR